MNKVFPLIFLFVLSVNAVEINNYINTNKCDQIIDKQLYKICIAKYGSERIGNGVVIPTDLYRIYFNNEANFERCFHYKNELNIDYKRDKLKQHEIDCKSIKDKY